MPRFLIQRIWDLTEEEMGQREVGARSRRIAVERYPDLVWEHSHVVMDEEGRLQSFCVYQAPDPDSVRAHAEELGDHTIGEIYEIGGDITPADFPI